MSSLSHDRWLITIFDIKLLNPAPSNKHPYILKVEITNSDRVSKLAEEILLRGQVSDEQIHLDATPESTVIFTVYERNGIARREKEVGRCETSVSSLIEMQRSSGSCKLSEGDLEIAFTIKDTLVQDALNEVIERLKDIHFNERQAWSAFFAYFKIVKGAINSVAGLHSYVQQVWNVLLLIPDSIEAHLTRNSNINQLCERLKDIYKFILDADRLPVFTITQTENLKLLFRQTLECVRFIKDYNNNSTGKNFLKGPIIENKVQEFQKSLNRLFDAIQRSLTLEMHIVVYDVLDLVREIHHFNLLGELPYAANAGFRADKKCLPGTREKFLEKILDWVNTDTTQQILVLSGQAGMGKSAIVHTIYGELKRADKVATTMFCFNRSDQNRCNHLFSTISRNLADNDNSFLQNLVQFIGEIEIRKSLDPTTQFDKLIVKPSKGAAKPAVIIIDALDESGDRESRRILLDLLFGRSPELPKNYRLIIATRPESDIEQQYQDPKHNVFCIHMADADPDDTRNDIRQFISFKLSDVAEILDKKFSVDWRSELARKAQGLFQWANLACFHIAEYNHIVRLRTLLSKAAPASLYEMYHRILDDKPGLQDEDSFIEFQTIIGAIVVSRKPLSIITLQALFEPLNEDLDVKAVLAPFRSLFVGIDDSTAEIRPLHTSLFDFFIGAQYISKCPNRYYIDTSNQASLTHACLCLMNNMLKFNICNLETSHRYNAGVENLGSLVKEAIPPHLSYACCFWAYHLKHSHLNNQDLFKEIRSLMENKLLYLFEALSLLGEVEHGCIGMRILEHKIKDKDDELSCNAMDAYRFGREFGEMMKESTPHLYLSALPFASKNSFIYKQFIHLYPQILNVEMGEPLTCPQVEYSMVKTSPRAVPQALAFSPKATQIATGFDDGSFRLWNYVTGEINYEWPPGIGIDNVVFSPNGELVYCCFSHGVILTCNTETKAITVQPYEFTQGECVGCTISSDGRYVAFALENDTGLLYDSGSNSKHTFEDGAHMYSYMSFSPNGNWFTFRGKDNMSRLWNTHTRTFFTPGAVQSAFRLVAFANYYIAFQNEDNLNSDVKIWDLRTNTTVSLVKVVDGCSWRHATFTPDERYLIYVSTMLHVHDVSTGDSIIKIKPPRLVEPSSFLPSEYLCAIAVSPDCKYIALGMSDKTVRMLSWDMLVQNSFPHDHNKEEEKERVWGVWLKGHHVILDIHGTEDVGYGLRILDTRLSDYKLRYSYEVEVSPEDHHWSIAYTVESRGLCLWDIDGREEVSLDESIHHYARLAFSPSGDRLIAGESSGKIKIWDVRSRQLISVSGLLTMTCDEMNALAFSSMGTTFIVAYMTSDKRVFVEEKDCISRDTLRGPFEAGNDPLAMSIAFSPDDKYFICVSLGVLKILDASTGASVYFDTMIRRSQLSPNGKYAAWILEEKDNELKVWDIEKSIMIDGPSFKDCIRNSSTSRNLVSDFGFSANSTLLYISHGDLNFQRVDIWDIKNEKLIIRSFPLYDLDGGEYVALHGDGLFSTSPRASGKIWDLRVIRVMSSLYEDHLKKSQFGALPAHIDTSETVGRSTEYGSSSENTETLEYALKAWDKAIFSPYAEMNAKSWMLGPHGELLFWVPPRMRSYLWRPSMSYSVDAAKGKFVKLNFDKFVHGTNWTKCRTSCT